MVSKETTVRPYLTALVAVLAVLTVFLPGSFVMAFAAGMWLAQF